jgi:hypothetical protein
MAPTSADGAAEGEPDGGRNRPEPSNRAPSGSSRTGEASTQAAIDRLPADATQPGGEPKATEEAGTGDADAPEPSDSLPTAGPHADPDLMNPDATPGTGALPTPGEHDDTDATSS